MIAKACAALAGALCLGASPMFPARTAEGIPPAYHPEIVKVECITGSGTAFYIAENTLVSVAHVTGGSGCLINDKPFEVVSKHGDFSILWSPVASESWLKVDCSGFVAGRTYTAFGYARGLSTLTSVDMMSKGDFVGGFARLWGVFHVLPGQSGGPVRDMRTGQVVGAVNVFNPFRGDSGSVELKGTSLCSNA